MNLQLTSATTRVKDRMHRRLAVAALGATLTVALAVGVATWQTAGHTNRADTAVAVAQPATTAIPPPDAGSVSLPLANDRRIVYIVRSQEEAQVLRRMIAEGDSVRAAYGQRPAPVSAVLVSDLDSATSTGSLPSAPGTIFMDLRTN